MFRLEHAVVMLFTKEEFLKTASIFSKRKKKSCVNLEKIKSCASLEKINGICLNSNRHSGHTTI